MANAATEIANGKAKPAFLKDSPSCQAKRALIPEPMDVSPAATVARTFPTHGF